MNKLKDQILELVQQHAARKAGALTDEYIHAAGSEMEAIRAGIDFEKWLYEACQECLGSSPEC